jgi:ubiquinone/menaquinone biosynthesis C-methylase UbiE
MVDSIWRTLDKERLLHFDRFIHDYEFIRTAEGRGNKNASYYHALPFEDLSKRNTRQWAIRARTYQHLITHVIRPMAEEKRRSLHILDLGAGNGWLSYRLSSLGHRPVAADILINPLDGLAAARHYRSHLDTMFPCLQAEADALPFASATFDMVIFNASFHYSINYETTLREALRCANASGAVIIADTPWYAKKESGDAMVEEKHANFLARYRFPSNAIASEEYLTPSRLNELSKSCSVQWTMTKPPHGIRWALRPVFASLNGRRTPSQFYVHMARVKP